MKQNRPPVTLTPESEQPYGMLINKLTSIIPEARQMTPFFDIIGLTQQETNAYLQFVSTTRVDLAIL